MRTPKQHRFGLATLALVGTVALMTTNARADFIFTQGNVPGPNEENILFQTPESGPSVTGFTNQTNVGVTFTSVTGQQLSQTAQGQADITCLSGCVDNNGNGPGTSGPNYSSQLTSIKITLASGFGATDFIGNPINGIGSATVTVTDQMGGSFTYGLDNGQNFFTIDAINNEVIQTITVTQESGSTGPFGFSDFFQPRVSGLCTLQGTTCTTIPVPEPATLAIFGTALAGLGLLRFRRRKNV